MKCKKHPKYKAIRKPTAACGYCEEMWFQKRLAAISAQVEDWPAWKKEGWAVLDRRLEK